ncbi:MAG TPA: hypothetical protein DCM40_07320, partial [Maribacter sp.]|nr:hypothetical protein [Maribacter sp.]
MFEDFTTNVPDLLTKQESDVLQVGTDAYFDIRPQYSYYDCLYEKIFSPVLNELELPSFYVAMPDLGFETSSRRSEGLSTPTIEDFEEMQFTKLKIADQFYNLNFYSNYEPQRTRPDAAEQVEFANAIQDIIDGNPEGNRRLAEFMSGHYGFNLGNDDRDIYLSRYTREQLDELYNVRYLNPMFVEIEMGSIEKSQLAESMTFNDDDMLMKMLFSSLSELNVDPFKGGAVGVDASYVEQLIESDLNSAGESMDVSIRFSDTVPIESTRTIDFSAWFKETFDFFTTGTNMSAVET